MRAVWGALAAALTLAACTTAPKPPVRPEPPTEAPLRPRLPAPAERSPPPPRPQGTPLRQLPGWAEDDHLAAFEAYRRACHLSTGQGAICAEARAFTSPTRQTARAFFEARFVARHVEGGPALLTGYFAPEYEARRRREGPFSAPVRPRPRDLIPGQPYPERAAIEARPADDALGWMRPEDLFFLQIQGSGTLTFPGGERWRAAFAAHNDRPFVGIARPMVERGLLEDGRASAGAIRDWLASHAGPEAEAIMRLNPRYVFFALEADDGVGPRGAAGLSLPAGRAVAGDPNAHASGDLLWIEAEAPRLAGAFPTYRRLVAALDTGGAIRGPVRADLYVGRGDAAGVEAGRIRHQLRMWRLVPRLP